MGVQIPPRHNWVIQCKIGIPEIVETPDVGSRPTPITMCDGSDATDGGNSSSDASSGGDSGGDSGGGDSGGDGDAN
jgi:uncharacterized membrane protein YgcG